MSEKRAGDVLDMDKLRELLSVGDVPGWWWMIRRARDVEVRATEHVGKGEMYALDPNQARILALHTDRLLPVMLLCHPDDRAQAEEIVREIRKPGLPHE